MSRTPGEDTIRKINGLLSYHLHIPHPEQLPDTVWADKWQQLLWVLEFEGKRFSGNKAQL
ncbi:MAG: hypothetical protein F9K23_00690 [Bacteroidetes bacterium]|nr:MAG: hypothetical protein F9K23_00690 [Bacteroidota bacterium]